MFSLSGAHLLQNAVQRSEVFRASFRRLFAGLLHQAKQLVPLQAAHSRLDALAVRLALGLGARHRGQRALRPDLRALTIRCEVLAYNAEPQRMTNVSDDHRESGGKKGALRTFLALPLGDRQIKR
eukprot:scaffold1712_cov261-Pinguiococcus_pyrenoidosus.AAC.4